MKNILKLIKFAITTLLFLFLILVIGCTKTEKTINLFPTCLITSPTNGASFEKGAQILISADIFDNDGWITEANCFIDGSIVSLSSFPYNFLWNTNDVALGTHTIKLVAIDNNKSVSKQEIEISITLQGSYLEMDTVSDFESNVYKTVKIGNQWWMAENLKTTHFADGTEIQLVESDEDWSNLNYTDKAYSFYNNSIANGSKYGALYTWAAAMNGVVTSQENPSGVQGVCPCGWHLPSDAEWIELEMQLGMSFDEADGFAWRGTDEGDKMKSISGWFNDGNGTNSSGFSALPGGERVLGPFYGLGEITLFWSSTEYVNITYLAFNRTLSYQHSGVGWFKAAHFYGYPKNYGFSVRCVKN